MERYHVIDILIDRPHVKSTVYLPLWIKRVTGVMFFPVIAPPVDGIPDGNPLGTAGLSLQNEKLNVVTNFKIYKKTPVFYESADYKTAEGEVFLDRGYSKHDYIECNDKVTSNSFMIFKYTNRKLVVTMNDAERFNADYKRLRSLVGSNVIYKGMPFGILTIQNMGEVIIIMTNRLFRMYEIHKNRLAEEIYQFIDPKTGEPFFKSDEINEDYDEAFVMKIILRYDDK